MSVDGDHDNGAHASEYDHVPYPRFVHTYTDVRRLATIGHLLGMPVAMPDRCRVLELGCGTGVNLLAMAELLPGSEFLGIDLSARQVETAGALGAAAGVTNARFERMDILDFPADAGRFDYIITHGLYSWVPETVREKILTICREHLAPNGLAFVSYNAYPGRFANQAVRRMLMYHTRGVANPRERAEEALRFAGFLAAESDVPGHPLRQVMADYLTGLETRDDATGGHLLEGILHDDLAPVNQPFFLHEFVGASERHGLQYVCDSSQPEVLPHRFRDVVEHELEMARRDWVDAEQHLDFVTGRGFRSSLLAQGEAAFRRELPPRAERLERLWVSTDAVETAPAAGAPSGAVRFETTGKLHITSDHPLTVAVMRMLCAASPGALAWPELLRAAQENVYGERRPAPEIVARDADMAAEALLGAFASSFRLATLTLTAPEVAGRALERPRMGAIARLLAASGEVVVPNAWFDRIELDPPSLLVAPLLDGSRTVEEAQEELRAMAAAGELAIEDNEGHDVTLELIDEAAESVAWLARQAMLTL